MGTMEQCIIVSWICVSQIFQIYPIYTKEKIRQLAKLVKFICASSSDFKKDYCKQVGHMTGRPQQKTKPKSYFLVFFFLN